MMKKELQISLVVIAILVTIWIISMNWSSSGDISVTKFSTLPEGTSTSTRQNFYKVQNPVKFFDIGEVGTIKDVTNKWGTVKLTRTYRNPVIVANPISSKGTQPAHARIRDVTKNSSSFKIRIEEWNYLDGAHSPEDVSYVVVEAGEHTLPNGKKVAANRLSISGSFKAVKFPTSFSTNPVVFASVYSPKKNESLVTRLQKISKTGFEIKTQREEKAPRVKSRIGGYIAIPVETYKYGSNTFFVGRVPKRVGDKWYTFEFKPLKGAYSFIADMQTVTGVDTGSIRYRTRTEKSIQIKVSEEQSLDKELKHNGEVVGYLLAGKR